MKIEEIEINGRKFVKTTPEEGFELVKVGTNEHYGEAIDLPNHKFEYVEVELPEVDDEQQNQETID